MVLVLVGVLGFLLAMVAGALVLGFVVGLVFVFVERLLERRQGQSTYYPARLISPTNDDAYFKDCFFMDCYPESHSGSKILSTEESEALWKDVMR